MENGMQTKRVGLWLIEHTASNGIDCHMALADGAERPHYRVANINGVFHVYTLDNGAWNYDKPIPASDLSAINDLCEYAWGFGFQIST